MEYPLREFSLEGRKLMVTGASSGIGRAVALLCAELGGTLVLNGRDQGRLEEVYRTLAGSGHKLVTGDLNDGKTIKQLVETESAYHGLVSCAGASRLVPFRALREKHIMEALEINYLAPMRLTQELIAGKRVKGGASLVYISALAARACPQAATAYSASKAALEAAVRTIGLELSRQGIRAHCVAPGYVQTPMLDGLSEVSSLDSKIGLTPLGSIYAHDVAPAVAWLLSPASRWITRSTLTVDGGISLPIRI